MRAMDPTLQIEQSNLSELTEMCCAFMLQFHNEICAKEKPGSVKRTFGQIYRSSSEAMKHEDQLRSSKESKKLKKEDGSRSHTSLVLGGKRSKRKIRDVTTVEEPVKELTKSRTSKNLNSNKSVNNVTL